LDDVSAKLAFIEARVALLERKLGHMLGAAEIGEEKPEGPIEFACNAPGVVITKTYPVEKDEAGVEFCWVGNDGPIQIVLPVRPSHALTCTLRLRPHPSVNFDDMVVWANDVEQPVELAHPNPRLMEVSFPVSAGFAPNVSIKILRVTSVRPSDFGESADSRYLAARFLGATVLFS